MPRMDKKPVLEKLKPHTAAKHAILRGYLQAWFPILQRYNGRIVFIDGFAGAGKYEGGEAGSPIITLDALLNHFSFEQWKTKNFTLLFCEPDSSRYPVLEQTFNDYKKRLDGGIPDNVKVNLIDEPFEDVANQILNRLEKRSRRLAPTFAFLDPFGVKGLPLGIICRLLTFERCEVLLNLAVKNMARFTKTPEFEPHLTRMFGDDRWRQILDFEAKERPRRLLRLYVDSLRDSCDFHFTWTFEMISRGTTSYYLVYGTRHIKGLEVMKDVMWKVDPSGNFRFSSRFEDNEVRLMDPAVSAHILRGALLKRFRGRTATVDELEEFVLLKTPYRKAHLRKEALVPLERTGKVSVERPGRHGYPPGTRVTFPPT